MDYYNCEREKQLVFFRNIFDQSLCEAYRRTEYGYVQNMIKELIIEKKIWSYLKKFAKKIIRK